MKKKKLKSKPDFLKTRPDKIILSKEEFAELKWKAGFADGMIYLIELENTNIIHTK